MVAIKEIAENIYLIDCQLYSIPKWGSVYLINEAKKALIDASAGTAANKVLEGIRETGISPEEIDYIMVTHVHLDHAGAAGILLKNMPRAQVVVHHRGAKHLIDPTRLVNSVIESQGSEAMRKYGEVVPIPAERVMPVSGDDIIGLGEEQVLTFIDAPGHAPHELCLYESRNNGLFTGDAVGVSVMDNTVLFPVTPPPSFDLELYLGTLDRLMALKATAIYFAHFGVTTQVQENLQLANDKLQLWGKIVAEAVKENGLDHARKKMRAQLLAELEPVKKMASLYHYLTEAMVPLNVSGYLKYYQEKMSRTEQMGAR